MIGTGGSLRVNGLGLRPERCRTSLDDAHRTKPTLDESDHPQSLLRAERKKRTFLVTHRHESSALSKNGAIAGFICRDSAPDAEARSADDDGAMHLGGVSRARDRDSPSASGISYPRSRAPPSVSLKYCHIPAGRVLPRLPPRTSLAKVYSGPIPRITLDQHGISMNMTSRHSSSVAISKPARFQACDELQVTARRVGNLLDALFIFILPPLPP